MANPKKYGSFYACWINMKSRCLNKNVAAYKNYGGRGIKICKKWLKFNGFKEDMLKSFEKGLTLERINNNKDYSKNNCRWATATEQANNRRNSRWIEFKGRTKTLAQWIRFLNLKSSTVRQRLYVYGWDIEKSLNTPSI